MPRTLMRYSWPLGQQLEARLMGYQPNPILAAHLQEKIKALSEAYHGRISGFTYCKLCESQPPASTLEHVELSLNASAGTLSGEITKYGQRRCLTVYYQDNQGSTIENVTAPEDFQIVQQEYNAKQHNLTAWINTKNGMATCTDYLALNNWDYCTQEVTDALVNAVTRCVEEEGLFSPETTDQPADNQEDSPIVKRLNQLIGEQEKIKIVDSEGTEIARSPDLATDQPEHFTVTIDANNQLSVKLTPDYLSSLGQTDPGALAALEQAFNDLLRQAKVSFCAGDTRSPDCTDQQLVFLQVLNLNVQSIALEAQLHPAMWDSQNAKNHLIPSAHGLPPVATGVADALVERVSDLPQLTLMLGGLVINDDNQHEALAGIFTAQGWQALKEGIFAELAATIRQQDKREHAVATASVNLMLGLYALLGYGPKLIAQLLDKIEDLAKKVDQAPHLAKYLKKVVQEAPSADLAKKLEQLLDNMDAVVLERLLAKLPEDKLDDFVTDLADNTAFRDALARMKDWLIVGRCLMTLVWMTH